MCNNCVPNGNPYRDAHPQSRLQLLPFHLSSHQQARSSAAAFINFHHHLWSWRFSQEGSQGLCLFHRSFSITRASFLESYSGAERLGEQASFSPKETKGLVKKRKEKKRQEKSDGESSWIPHLWLQPEINMKNNESPESEQLRMYLRLHSGAALKSHLEFPESQVITFKLSPKPIFWEPWRAGISAKNNAVAQLLWSSRAPCPPPTFTRQESTVKDELQGDSPLWELFSFLMFSADS